MQSVEDLASRFQNMGIANTDASPTLIIKNAHRDDIHGFLSVAPGIFASGSKDNTVKLWDINNRSQQTLTSQEKGYKYWVTALAKVSDDTFASGTRDGAITIWDLDGKERLSFVYKPSKSSKDETICKDRNKQRINCISRNVFGEPNTFFTGTPRFIQLWDATTGKIQKYWKAHANDWVYCIEPLKPDSFICVIGAKMDVWSELYAKSPKVAPLIEEKRTQQQRPHISAIVRLVANPDLLPCALFDGSVRVVNLTAKTVETTYSEHTGRVWSVIELQPNLIASSADDHTIKLWDLRQKKSVVTLAKNPGRVSSLLKLNDTQFISGSCPDDVFKSKEKATISFWDIRQILPPEKLV